MRLTPTLANHRTPPLQNKTFHIWHIFVKGLKAGTLYAFRVSGPNSLAGLRYNRNKVLTDPYSRANIKTLWNRVNACDDSDNVATSLRAMVIDTGNYDWEGDQPLKRPIHETIIYEMHVGGFTRSPSAGRRSTPARSRHSSRRSPTCSDWASRPSNCCRSSSSTTTTVRSHPARRRAAPATTGATTRSASSPRTPPTASAAESRPAVNEFRDMVKALHHAGIEVILDVVFNHTGEGNHERPDHPLPRHRQPALLPARAATAQYYMDFTGCGNTVNSNHPSSTSSSSIACATGSRICTSTASASTKASILARGEDGMPLVASARHLEIELADALADTKLIAEAWDAAGLYQVGTSPAIAGPSGTAGIATTSAASSRGDPGLRPARWPTRFAGSADLYQGDGAAAENSVNFITCHDGFTLNDLVSYNAKHNEANGEDNRDGIYET